MSKGRLWVVAGLLVGATLLVACGSSDKKDETGSSGSTSGTQAAAGTTAAGATQAAVKVKRGGTLNVALANNPKTFDPMLSNDTASGAIVDQVFEGLYSYDENFKPVPWLAEKVDVNADSTVWTFFMRKGVKFHDGTEVNAEAVKFSMERIRNNQASVGYADAKTITDITVIDPYTVRVTLSEPFAPFPSRLTGRLGAVVSPKAVREMGDEKFGLNPVGTGPFKFGEWKNDVSVTAVKHPDYWKNGADGQKLPYLDKVEWKIISEPAARLTALQAGDVDLSAVRDQDLPIVKKDPNLVFKEDTGRSFSGLWLTINRPPFDNKSLRQAVAFALDREEINKAIFEGTRTLSNGAIPPPMSWAVDKDYKPYTFDQTKARQKLAEGGRPNGFEFEHWVSAGNQQDQQLAELIQAQLAKVGIKMNIQFADFNGVVIPKLMKGEGNSYALGLSGGVDPDQFIAGPFQTGGSFNFFPYSNPQVDELIKKGRSVSNLEERAKIYKDVNRLIMEDSPYIFTTHGVARHIGNKKVQGWFIGLKATSGYAEYWKE